MQYAESILDLVGHTPLVRLSRVLRDLGPAARQPLEACRSIRCREGVEPDPPQQLDEDFARCLVVVDHEHLVELLHH